MTTSSGVTKHPVPPSQSQSQPQLLPRAGLHSIFPPEIVSRIWNLYASSHETSTLCTLVRVCKLYFRRYTPLLYAHVELSYQNVLSFFHGLGGEFGPSGAEISGLERRAWYDQQMRQGSIARRITLLGMVEDAVICDGAAYEACLRALKVLAALDLPQAPNFHQIPEYEMTSYDPHVLFPGIHLKVDLEFRDRGLHCCGHLVFAQEALAYIQMGREDDPPLGTQPFNRLCCNKAAMIFQFPQRISLLLVEYVTALAQAYQVSDYVCANLLPTEIHKVSVEADCLCIGLRERGERGIYDFDYSHAITRLMGTHFNTPRTPQYCVYVEEDGEQVSPTTVQNRAVEEVNIARETILGLIDMGPSHSSRPFDERDLEVVDKSYVWKNCELCRRYLFPQLYPSLPAPPKTDARSSCTIA
ncbi:hypothetical protein IAR50_004473 [Cryptococcus sp. DSM 104548]